MDNNLIDLDPPREEEKSSSGDETIVSDTTVLYRAQVAVEGGSRIVNRGNVNPKTQTDQAEGKDDVNIPKLKSRKNVKFSIKRPDDKEEVNVSGLIAVNDRIITVDNNNKELKLFDQNGSYLSAIYLIEHTYGITSVEEDRFATCGYGNKVFLWILRGDIIISEDVVYDVDQRGYGIHFNGIYYCVLHSKDNAITILDRQGRRVRKIVMEEAFGRKVKYGCGINMDRDTHNMFIPCQPENRGVLSVSLEGEALWFTPLPDAGLFGITEIHGELCLADGREKCLHLISKTGQYKGILLEKEELEYRPLYIHYDARQQKLYIGHGAFQYERDTIAVYYI